MVKSHGLVLYIRVRETDHQWLRKWLVILSSPSHWRSQCCLIINWSRKNKIPWFFFQNTAIIIQEDAFDNIVFYWRPFCLDLSALIPYLIKAYIKRKLKDESKVNNFRCNHCEILKQMFYEEIINKRTEIMLLIGCQQSQQHFRNHVRQSLLTTIN